MSIKKVCSLAAWAVVLSLVIVVVSIQEAPQSSAATFTYSNPNCASFAISGTPPTQTVTCVTASGGGGGSATPVCAPSANPATPSSGQSTTISANCSNQPTSYAWTGSGCSGVTAGTCTVTQSKTTTVTYSVSGTNASGSGAAAQVLVSWK